MAAVDADLRGWGMDAVAGRLLLTALAWSDLPGLPAELWVPLACALRPATAPGHRPVTAADAHTLVTRGRAYLTRDVGPGGGTVYRLMDSGLAAALRGEPAGTAGGPPPGAQAGGRWRAQAERRIAAALLAIVPTSADGRSWEDAHPYLLSSLARHALAAGPDTVLPLARDLGFLSRADPSALGHLLAVSVPDLDQSVRAYQRTRPLMGDEPAARLAYLIESAHAIGVSPPPPAPSGTRPLYRTRLAAARRDDSLLTFTGHTGIINHVAFGRGPGGQLLLATAGDDHTVRIWDPLSGAPLGEPLTGHAGMVNAVAFGVAAGGRTLLASCGADRIARVWDPLAGTLVAALDCQADVVLGVSLGATPDGRLLLATTSVERTVRLWDPLAGTPAGAPLAGHSGWVYASAFGTMRGDGEAGGGQPLLATASADRTVRLWDPLAGTPAGAPLAGHADAVWAAEFATAPDGRLLLATASRDRTVRVWDTKSRTGVCEPIQVPGVAHHVAFGTVTDGEAGGGRLLLATAGGDRTVRLWDPLTGEPAGEPLVGHRGEVYAVACGTGPAGRLLLASVSGDSTVRVWDATPRSGMAGGHRPAEAHWVSAVAFGAMSGNGKAGGRLLLASGSDDERVTVWDPYRGAPLGQPLRHAGPVDAVALGSMTGISSGEGRRAGGAERLLLASAGGDRAVRVWDGQTGAPVAGPLTGHAARVRSVAFGTLSGGGETGEGRLVLASAGDDQCVRLWDPLTGTPAGEPLTGHTGSVDTVAFGTITRTGETGVGRLLLASAGADRTIRVWDPVTGETLSTMPGAHSDAVRSLAFGTVTDGETGEGRLVLASAGDDQCVRLWDPLTGTPAGEPLTGHTGWVAALAFTTAVPRGGGAPPAARALLASGGGDKQVRLWDLASGSCLLTVRRLHPVRALSAAWPLLAIGDSESLTVAELDESVLNPPVVTLPSPRDGGQRTGRRRR